MHPSRRIRDLPLWEPKFSTHNLRELEKDEATFNQGFRMQVIHPGDLLFPSFSTCYQNQLAMGDLWRRGMPVAVGVDLSSDKRPGTAIVAVGLELQTRTRIPLEVRVGAWSSPQTVEQIDEVCRNHNVLYVMVENNGYQESLIEWVVELKGQLHWWSKVEGHTTGKNKADPRFGLPGFEVEFKNKGWALPAGEWAGHPYNCKCAWCRFAKEFSMYPKYPTTDVVMAAWFAKSAIDRWMWSPGSSTGLGNLNLR